MNTISAQKIVSHSPADMYALVNNVAAYADFLPCCTQSVVHHETEDEIKATLTLSSHGFTKSITTQNRMQKNKIIEIRLVEGPLKHLEGFWRFESLNPEASPENKGGCQIFFDVKFEFLNRFIGMTLEPLLNKAADAVIDSFSIRADNLYGSK